MKIRWEFPGNRKTTDRAEADIGLTAKKTSYFRCMGYY